MFDKREKEMISIAEVESIRDFAAGVTYAIPWVSLAMLAARRGKQAIHYAGMAFFGHLSVLDTVLFVVFYVVRAEWAHVGEAVDMYQLTVVPFGVVVLYELTHPRARWGRILAIHALPFYAVLLAYVAFPREWLYRAWMVMSVAYGALSIWSAHRSIERYERLLRESLSDTEGVDLRWLRRIAWCCLGVLTVWATASAANIVVVDAVYNVVVSAILFAMAFCLYRQEVADVEEETDEEKEEEDGDTEMREVMSMEEERRETCDGEGERKEDCKENADSRLGDGGGGGEDAKAAASAYDFAREFGRLFDEEKIYLDKTVSVAELSKRLCTNRSYISRYMNNELGTTFYDYVNRRRTEHAKTLLRETDMKIEAVGDESGFNSVMSFRRAFTAYEGMTPGEYRERARGEAV